MGMGFVGRWIESILLAPRFPRTAHPPKCLWSSLPPIRLGKSIAEQFGNKLDEHKEVIFQLRHELQEKETQLRLLPDLQKKLEEEEKLKDFETTALRKQIEELNKENAILKEAAELQTKAASKKKSAWSWLTGK